MTSDLHILEELLGHRFSDIGLLEEALTHSSFSSGGRGNNERLEFLGDRILGLVVAEALFHVFGEKDEGELSGFFHYLVSGEYCTLVARELDLQRYLQMAPIKHSLRERMLGRVLGNACEALVGALYLDGGLNAARAFILDYWKISEGLKPRVSPKNRLQEWALAHYKEEPFYECIDKRGMDNMPDFTVRVSVGSLEPVTAQGPSLRKAEKEAARRFIERHKLDMP